MASLRKRNGIYYAQVYVGGKQVRQSLKTKSYQLAKAKLAEIQSQASRTSDKPLPIPLDQQSDTPSLTDQQKPKIR